MFIKHSKALKVTALMLALSMAQAYVLAGSTKAIENILPGAQLLMPEVSMLPALPPQAIKARLTTRGNQPVSVNGNNVTSGATILSGATIETGDGVGATINLGPLGSIDIAPNSKVTVEFSSGQIKVTIFQGCAIVRNKKGASAQVYAGDKLVTSNNQNQKQAGVLDVCMPAGAPAAIVNQGAAGVAGAGSGSGGAGAAAAAGAGGGSGIGPSFGKIFLFGLPVIGSATALAVIVPCRRGRNPSPGVPRGVNDECRD